MPKRDLTPTQARVLADLAAGGYIHEGTQPRGGYTLFRAPGLSRPAWYTVAAPTFDALWRDGYLGQVPNTYPYCWGLSAAGRDRAAQPAGAPRPPAQEGES